MQRITVKSEETYDERCRVCLQCAENMIPILNSVNVEGKTSYWDVISFISKVNFENLVNTPQMICACCAEKANTSYEFKLLCESSDEILQKGFLLDTPEFYKIYNDYKIEITENTIQYTTCLEQKDLKPFSIDNSIGDIIESNCLYAKDVSTEIPNYSIQHKSKTDKHNIINESNDAENNSTDANRKHARNCSTEIPNTSLETKPITTHLDCFFTEDKHNIVNEANSEYANYSIQSKSNTTVLEYASIDEKHNIINENNEESKIACNFCDYICPNNSYQKHMQEFHKQESVGCELCGKILSTSNALRVHTRKKHQNDKNYPDKCETCDFMPLSYSSFNQHMANEHGVKLTVKKCNFCDYTTDSTLRLGKHKTLSHNDKKNFQCDKCDKKFFTRSLLLVHNKTQHELNLRNKCEICGKYIKGKGNLNKHMRIHSELKEFDCKECGKRFTRSITLHQHMFSHTEDRNFKCEVCGGLFKTSKAVNQHVILVHNKKVKRYECAACGKLFSRPGRLEEHMFIHMGIKQHKCDVCGKSFSVKWDLVRHLVVHTGEKRYVCEICGKRFTQSHVLRSHLNTHSKQS